MTATAVIRELAERQLGNDTRLRRVTAIFQRKLGDIFGNARVRRRRGRYEIDVAVYEKPLPDGTGYRIPEQRIRAWVAHAAGQAHPKLYTRLGLEIGPWAVGRVSNKQFCWLRIIVSLLRSPSRELTTANMNVPLKRVPAETASRA